MFARVRVFALLLLAVALVGGGCARYEYDLLEPADVAQRIGRKQAVVVPMEPAVRYEARAYSDRLVLFVFNESDEPLKLLGDDSYAVDPRGESHPLPTRTVAPGSSTKLIFPPVRPTLRQSGPSFGIGLGVGLGSARRRGHYGGVRHGAFGDPFYDDHPRYYQLTDDGTTYWNWSGNGTEVSVRLVYQRGAERFEHEFTFRRVRA
jgi:hypothetical protein